MNILQCAVLCYTIFFPDVNQRMVGCTRMLSAKIAASLYSDNRYVYDHHFFDTTFGASLKECSRVPTKELLERISYYVEFDGDGKVCR